MDQTRRKERRFVYIQCKVLTGWRSLKFRDAGGTGSRHPSPFGARPRPCVPAHDRACGIVGAGLTIQPNQAKENKM